jgi:hypothetical protein
MPLVDFHHLFSSPHYRLSREETIDETVSHRCFVRSLDRVLPLAAARGGANMHFTGLLHQNCSHHTD